MNFSRNAALWIIVILLLFALFNLFQGSAMRGAQEDLKYSEFVTKAEKGEVSEPECKKNGADRCKVVVDFHGKK